MATATADGPAPTQASRPDEPLDTTIRLITPERITFLYPLAGPFRRTWAYVIDAILWILLAVLALTLSGWLTLGGEAGIGLFLVVLFALQWGYGAFWEGLFNGRTPGKRIMKLRVVSALGTPVTGGQAVLRNLTWPVEGAVPFGFLPALASMVLTRKFQRLGDLAAGTMVVVESSLSRAKLPRPNDQAILGLLPLLPRRVEAGPELSRALADYVKHRGRFGKARREEMAAHLADPLRLRYGLPTSASGDAVLCALYHRVFLEG